MVLHIFNHQNNMGLLVSPIYNFYHFPVTSHSRLFIFENNKILFTFCSFSKLILIPAPEVSLEKNQMKFFKTV